jgi:TRAP-type C4-dicarboxylate transport system substrate-binding protein
MKRTRLLTLSGSICLVFVLMVALFAVAHAQPASKQAPIELKFAHYSPPGHPMIEGIAAPWSKMVEEKTKGKVKVTIYPAETLCKMADTFDAVASGIADIGYGLTQITPGRFPLSMVVTIPFAPWTSSSALASQVAQKLYVEGKIAKEWSDVKLLFIYTTPPSTIFLTKPVRTLKDAKGTKIVMYAHTAEGEGLEAIGFTPVTLPTPEVYLGLQRGIVEGTTLTWESCGGRKIYEVAKYALDLKMCTVPFYYVMNLKKWNSLPPDVKEGIDSVSGMWGAKFAGETVDAFNQRVKTNVVVPALKEVIALSPDELERWQKTAGVGKDWWITGVEKKGIPGKEIYEAAVRITKEIK